MYWYITFATEERSLGATVIENETATGAILEATSRGLNPGGLVALVELPDEMFAERPFLVTIINRLASAEELKANGCCKYDDLDADDKRAIDEDALYGCSECNEAIRQGKTPNHRH